MPLKLVKRHNSSNFYLRGTIFGFSVDESTGTGDREAAEKILVKRQKELLDESVHGPSATKTFAHAALAYMEGGGEKKHLDPILAEIGTLKLAQINQDTIDKLAFKLKPKAKPQTRNRAVFTPCMAVVNYAAGRGWCAKLIVRRPASPPGRNRWITQQQADDLVRSAAAHLKPLLTFLFGTGVRLNEALKLDWSRVDLGRRHASIMNQGLGARVKNNESRGIPLPPRVVAALEALPHRDGAVFRTHYGKPGRGGERHKIGAPYADREGEGGGEIDTAFRTACRKAGISDFSPHACRHSWASWHYAKNRNLPQLMALGGWKDIRSVLRYTHINVEEHAASVADLWPEPLAANRAP